MGPDLILKQGDVILALNGVAYAKANRAALKEAYKVMKPGNTITYTVAVSNGGPGIATESMTLHSFFAWRTQDLGGSAAIAYMLLFVSVVISVSFFHFVVRRARRETA